VDSAEVDGADTDDPRPTSDDGSASSPDLAEVEAAAEELDQNDISWVDEDDADEDRGADEDETSAMESSDADPATAGEEASAEDGLEEQFEREEEWRETRRIPSIDPENSEAVSDSSAGGREAKPDRSSPDRSSSEQSSNPADTSAADAPSNDARADSQDSAAAETSTASAAAASGPRTGRSQDPESERSRSEAADVTDPSDERVVALTEKVETLQEHRDALVAKADELEAERDRLQSKTRISPGPSSGSRRGSRNSRRNCNAPASARSARRNRSERGHPALGPAGALGTNLFVRYGSKSQPTLETAHGGNADRSEVASNLRLEHHTGFDSTDAAVDGTPYEEFLESTMEYRFVDWVTEMLLYEIRDTGNADGLGDLYDAIPRIDRAELGATISLARTTRPRTCPIRSPSMSSPTTKWKSARAGHAQRLTGAGDAGTPRRTRGSRVRSEGELSGSGGRDRRHLELLRTRRARGGRAGHERGLPQPGLETELRQPLTEERLPPLSGRVPFRRVPHERPRAVGRRRRIRSGFVVDSSSHHRTDGTYY